MNTKGLRPTDQAILERIAAGLGGGTTVVDTGNVALVIAGATPIATTFNADTLFISNVTDEVAYATVQDGAGAKYLDTVPIEPRTPLVLALGGIVFTNGLTWSATVNGALRAQMLGTQ